MRSRSSHSPPGAALLLAATLLASFAIRAQAQEPRGAQHRGAPARAAQPAPAPARAATDSNDALARAAELIDAGKPTEAAALLDARIANRGDEPQALLLRSTARFMLGDLDAGERDLRRALELDPKLRQGWLNLAAVEMASARYEPAYQAFLRAEQLDGKAPDNDVNLGAALLFLGRLEEASQRFESYIASQPGGDAYYLVATNYAAAGYSALALRHLGDAIRRDEKIRLRARTDANFSQIATTPDYQRLLATDSYVPPAGSLQASDVLAAPYSDSDTRVVNAVLDALGALRVPYDRRVEVTPEWALVWADMRIKVRRQGPEETVVEVSAPPASFTPQAFEKRVQAFFGRTRAVLLSYRSQSERLGLPKSDSDP